MEEYKLLEIILDAILYVPLILLTVYFIAHMILYASSKRYRKWSEEHDKRMKEWQEGYKIRKELRERDKRYKKIQSGKYDSHTWQYYAQKNGFYPEDEPVD